MKGISIQGRVTDTASNKPRYCEAIARAGTDRLKVIESVLADLPVHTHKALRRQLRQVLEAPAPYDLQVVVGTTHQESRVLGTLGPDEDAFTNVHVHLVVRPIEIVE